MKKCPFCAEEVQDEAIKCKHCKEMIGQPPPAGAPAPSLSEDEINRTLDEVNSLLASGKAKDALTLALKLKEQIELCAEREKYKEKLVSMGQSIARLQQMQPATPTDRQTGGCFMMILGAVFLVCPVPPWLPIFVFAFALALFMDKNSPK